MWFHKKKKHELITDKERAKLIAMRTAADTEGANVCLEQNEYRQGSMEYAYKADSYRFDVRFIRILDKAERAETWTFAYQRILDGHGYEIDNPKIKALEALFEQVMNEHGGK